MNENNCLNKYDSYNLIHVNWNNYNTNMISKSSPCIKYDIILLFFRLFAFIYMLSTSIMFFLIDNSFTENQEINFIYLTLLLSPRKTSVSPVTQLQIYII